MSRQVIDRRDFLTLPLVFILLPLARAHAAAVGHIAPYRVDVSLLYGALTYRIDETLSESVDKTGGRYEVAVTGEGDGIANRIDSAGILRQGRWAPLRTQSFFSVKGRESRSNVTYDYTARQVDYHFKGETFYLRRLRVVDDTVRMPEGVHIDEASSATLKYDDKLWPTQADGSLDIQDFCRQLARAIDTLVF